MMTCLDTLIDVAPTNIRCIDRGNYNTNTKYVNLLNTIDFELFQYDYIPDTTGSLVSNEIKANIHKNEDSGICFRPLFELFQKYNSKFFIQEEFINHINCSNFFFELGRVYTQASVDDTLDFVFKTIDKMLLDGDYSLCDKILSHVVIENFSTDILLSIATVTFPWRFKLSCRENFIQRLKDHLKRILPIDTAKEISYYL